MDGQILNGHASQHVPTSVDQSPGHGFLGSYPRQSQSHSSGENRVDAILVSSLQAPSGISLPSNVVSLETPRQAPRVLTQGDVATNSMQGQTFTWPPVDNSLGAIMRVGHSIPFTSVDQKVGSVPEKMDSSYFAPPHAMSVGKKSSGMISTAAETISNKSDASQLYPDAQSPLANKSPAQFAGETSPTAASTGDLISPLAVADSSDNKRPLLKMASSGQLLHRQMYYSAYSKSYLSLMPKDDQS